MCIRDSVAQTFSLLYRRFPNLLNSRKFERPYCSWVAVCKFGRPAGCNPAIQQVKNLRYFQGRNSKGFVHLPCDGVTNVAQTFLSLIHISAPPRLPSNSYAPFCL